MLGLACAALLFTCGCVSIVVGWQQRSNKQEVRRRAIGAPRSLALIWGLPSLLSGLTGFLGRRRVPEILQFEVTECGTCCVAMVLTFFGRWEPMDRLRGICGATRDGVSAAALARAATQMGMDVKGFGVAAEELADLPMPQIIFWNFNHFIVLEKVNGDVVDVVDPAVGRRRLRFAELEAGYCGVTLCMQPNAKFKATGGRPSVFKELAKAAKGAGGAIAAISLVSFGLALIMALVPALTSIFIDYVLIKKGVAGWQYWFMLGIVLLGLALGPLNWMQKAGALKLQTRIALSLATRIVTQLFAVPLDYFARRSGGEIGGRVMLADAVAGTVSGVLVNMIASAMQVLVIGLAMLSYSVYLTGIAFALLFLHALLSNWIRKRTMTLNRRLAIERGRYEAQVISAVGLVEHSRASGSTGAMFGRVLERYVAVANSEQANAPYAALAASLPIAVTGILTALIAGLSALEVIKGDFTVGLFVAFNAMAYILLSPFNQIVSGLTQISNAGGSFDRVNDLLEVDAIEPVFPNAGVPTQWTLVGQDITFSYGNQQVLRGVSLSIPQGSYLGVVGGVGSGKSTLLNILARVMRPSSGQILVGGVPLNHIEQENFCGSIALVPQKDQIFEGTVLDNITLWDPNITEKDVSAACQLCAIHSDIVRRPGGYRSKLREGGGDLSGGQRQRIALARAVVRNPKILVLDEATSALDGKTEAVVLSNLREVGMTLVFATHRIATMRFADNIVVVEGGQIRETGSPEQLIAAGGVYAKMVSASAGVAI